jgi:hypothetical protein
VQDQAAWHRFGLGFPSLAELGQKPFFQSGLQPIEGTIAPRGPWAAWHPAGAGIGGAQQGQAQGKTSGRIQALPLEQLEALADALLDFSG